MDGLKSKSSTIQFGTPNRIGLVEIVNLDAGENYRQNAPARFYSIEGRQSADSGKPLYRGKGMVPHV